MGRRITILLTWLSVALILALSPLASFAEPAPPPPIFVDPTELYLPPPGFAGAAGQVAVLIELADTSGPVGGETPAARSQRLAAAQAVLLPALASSGARVLYLSRLAVNGIAVLAPAGQIDGLSRLPGVARVSLIPPKLPASDTAAALATASPVVSAIAGATGQGVRIGVIDRGIDYTHADFGGAGTPAAYAANDPAVVEPGSFPTAKVVGGYDFAGDAYNAATAATAVPAPDPDPLECNRPIPGVLTSFLGQGTHVAGLVAGYGVMADGSTYRGPYEPGADYSTFKVAPGVAPEADLFALKIFGCQGSTTLLAAAIERAIDPNDDGDPSDHLDVLVISLGTPFGSADDPDARAVDNAVRAGVAVVVAAGDTINTFYSVSSPASARLAITVGASDGAGGIAANSARGPARGNHLLKPDIVATGVAVRSAAVGTGVEALSMTGTAAAASQVAGAAALLRQLHPAWSPAQVKAALMNSATPIQAPPSLAGAGQLSLAGLESASLLGYGESGGGLSFGAPWVAASTTATRTLLLENTGADDQIVTLSATAVATETGVTVDVPAGPIVVPAHGVARAVVDLSIDTSGLGFTADPATQPQQYAVARHYLAEHGGYINVSGAGATGTRVRPGHAAHFRSVDFYLDDLLLDDSLDSREVQEYVSVAPGPHTVILRRQHSSPDSPPLFSAPVDLLDGKDYTLLVIGRPRALDILVVDDTVTAPPPAGQALIHFVNANRVEPNWDIGPLDVYLDGVLRVPALPVGEASAYIPIAPGEHTVAFYKAGVDPALERYESRKTFVVAAGETVLAGTGRHDDEDDDEDEDGDDEQRAFVGIAPARVGDALLASVPYNIFPTLASDAHVAAGVVGVQPGSRSFAFDLSNGGARNAGLTGVLPSERTPLASAYQLQARSAEIAGLGPSQRAADVQYLGVTSNFSATQNISNTLVYFGLSTYAPWSTPNEVQFRVYIDSNRDGVDDFVLVNTNTGATSNRAPSDVFTSVLYPIRPDGTLAPSNIIAPWGSFLAPSQSRVNVAPYNTSVMFQLARVRLLAPPLDPANPAGPKGQAPALFCYHVETRARDNGIFTQTIDRVPEASSPPVAACGNRSGVLLYDVANAAITPINTTNFIFAPPGDQRPLFLDVDGGQITGGVNPARLTSGVQILVLHHHNAPSSQAEVVPVAVGPVEAAGGQARSRTSLPFVER